MGSATTKLNHALDATIGPLTDARGRKAPDYIKRRTTRAQAVTALLAEELGRSAPKVELSTIVGQLPKRRRLFGFLRTLTCILAADLVYIAAPILLAGGAL